MSTSKMDLWPSSLRSSLIPIYRSTEIVTSERKKKATRILQTIQRHDFEHRKQFQKIPLCDLNAAVRKVSHEKDEVNFGIRVDHAVEKIGTVLCNAMQTGPMHEPYSWCTFKLFGMLIKKENLSAILDSLINVIEVDDRDDQFYVQLPKDSFMKRQLAMRRSPDESDDESDDDDDEEESANNAVGTWTKLDFPFCNVADDTCELCNIAETLQSCFNISNNIQCKTPKACFKQAALLTHPDKGGSAEAFRYLEELRKGMHTKTQQLDCSSSCKNNKVACDAL